MKTCQSLSFHVLYAPTEKLGFKWLYSKRFQAVSTTILILALMCRLVFLWILFISEFLHFTSICFCNYLNCLDTVRFESTLHEVQYCSITICWTDIAWFWFFLESYARYGTTSKYSSVLLLEMTLWPVSSMPVIERISFVSYLRRFCPFVGAYLTKIAAGCRMHLATQGDLSSLTPLTDFLIFFIEFFTHPV